MKQGKIAMLDAIFTDPQVPSALGMSKERAYARAYLGFACLEYAAGCTEDAQADLALATRLDPSLLDNNADRLLESVAAYAWNHLTEDPERFTNRVFSNLPEDLAALRHLRRRALARTWMVGAFRAYQHNDVAGARENAFRATAAAPGSLLNRGFALILARSLIGSSRPGHAQTTG
jgi:hypothetical protein